MKKWIVISLLGLLVVSYIAALGARPLFLPDEVRYAEIPREMAASGDWIVPRLNGLRYFEKPVFGYWLTSLSMGAFGENNFAVRLPSAVSAVATALAVFLLVRRFGGGVIPAALTAAVLLTCGEFYGVGCYNVLDMPLTMFLSAGMVFFYFAYKDEEHGRKALYLTLFGLCLGGAFLTKGFLALALPCVVIAPLMLWERDTGKLFRLAWIPLIAVVLVSAPWAILVHLREPDFWRHFFWEEHVRRFFSHSPQHPEPFWYFLPVIIGGAMPWTVLMPAAAMGIRRKDFENSLIRFAICWLVFPFIFFSASRGKLGTYILPCFPPLALLVAHGLSGYFAQGKRKVFEAGAYVLMGSLIAGAAVVAGWRLGRFGGFPYGQGEDWKWALGLTVIIVWAGLTWLAAKRQNSHSRILLFSAAPLLSMIAVQFIMPEALEELRAPAEFLRRNAVRVDPSQPLFARKAIIQAVCWHYKRSDVHILGRTGEFKYGLTFDDAKGRAMSYESFAGFLVDCPSETLVTVVLDGKHYRREKDELPKPEFEDMNGGFVFVQYRGANNPGE